MTPRVIADVVTPDERADIEKLVARWSLSDEQVQRIEHAQQLMGLSFAEAGQRLGLIKEAGTSAPSLLSRALQTTAQPDKALNRLALTRSASDPRSADILALRTELLLRHDAREGANIIAVLSPCAGDGRSRLAADLAIAFAKMNRPTLLVDADLRDPQQHLHFGIDNRSGLAQAIASGEPAHIHTLAAPESLHLLTAGAAANNPLELLSDLRFESMINEWRRHYDFVVIDTAPVQQCSDALAVATLVGRVLVVSRSKFTPYKEMHNMLRRLAATQSLILGAVINHF